MSYVIAALSFVGMGFLLGHQMGADTARIEVCQLQGGALLIDTDNNAVCMKQSLIIWRVK